jgi:hypothetical protein
MDPRRQCAQQLIRFPRWREALGDLPVQLIDNLKG